MDNFINTTYRSTVAVIVPLYGYWNDVPDNQLLAENVLALVTNRIRSSVHQLIVVFVANPETLDDNPKNPKSVGNVILSMTRGGNVKNVPVPRDATYPTYVAEGMRYALEETKAAFMVVLNPWVMVQHIGIDSIVDRANFGDEAKLISGYDIHQKIAPAQFDTFNAQNAPEEWDISFDFLCAPRFAAELYKWDRGAEHFATNRMYAFDLAQTLKVAGYAAISYPQAPIFPFEFSWADYETNDMRNGDKQTFTKKWGFSIAD